MENEIITATSSFSQLGISPQLLGLLTRKSFTVPTPIQHQAIPVAIKGQDVIGIAQTGTGNTLGFGIPMLDVLSKTKGVGVIIVPTRELALQVEESLRPFADGMGMRTAVLIGGASMQIQRQILQKRPRIIVATPGRLIDHMERFRLSLHDTNVLVLDEADRMLDMGFAPQINRILESVPEERQTMLFSATMPSDIVRIAHKHMKTPTHIEVAPAGTANELVEQELFFVRKDDRPALLNACLKDATGSVLVFTRTKHGASKINKIVHDFGYKADEIHSNKSLAARKRALADFKSGKIRVLVATDIAARGIDVKNISLVINFDVPENPDDYVHRIGRTGRAGSAGKAITFAMPDQVRDVRDIERLVKKAITLGVMPEGITDPRVNKLASDGTGGGGKKFHYKDRNFGRAQGDESRRDFGRRPNRPYRAGGSQGGPAGRSEGRPSFGGGQGEGGGRREARGRAATGFGGGRSAGFASKPSGTSYGRSEGRSYGERSSGGQGGYAGRRSGGTSARTGGSSAGRPGGRSNSSGYGRPSGGRPATGASRTGGRSASPSRSYSR